MTRRLKWILSLPVGLALSAGPSLAQDKTPTEMPRTETPAPAPAPGPMPVYETPVVSFAPALPPRASITASAEVLQWWYKRDNIPSLLNTGNETSAGLVPVNGKPPVAAPGTDADPGAITLFGGDQYQYNTVTGVRADLSIALLDNVDFELNGFLAEQVTVNRFFAGQNGTPFLTRPFFNQHDIIESGYDTSSKFGVNGAAGGGLSGTMDFDAANRFYGYEANIAWALNQQDSKIYKLIAGFRQITLDEHLIVTENVTANQDGLLAFFPTRNPISGLPDLNFNFATDSIRIVDGFVTRNAFYGGQLGAMWKLEKGPLSFDFLTKFAVGVNHETITVSGVTQRYTNGTLSGSGAGGLLAVSTNSGQVVHNNLAVVPELLIKLNYDLTSNIRVYAGYNMLYMSSVVRPGNQIDRRINPELVPHDVAYNPTTSGPLFPVGFFRDTDFFATGVSFGLQVRY